MKKGVPVSISHTIHSVKIGEQNIIRLVLPLPDSIVRFDVNHIPLSCSVLHLNDFKIDLRSTIS